MARFRLKLLVSGNPIADFLPSLTAAEEKAIELDYAWRHESGDLILDPFVLIEVVGADGEPLESL